MLVIVGFDKRIQEIRESYQPESVKTQGDEN